MAFAKERKTRNRGRWLAFPLVMLAAMSASITVYGDALTDIPDGIDRNDPKFVTASLLVMDPGNELFSSVGHAAIRLECPTFTLDNCFSYESERAVDRLPAFFAGTLKMGMFAVETDKFLEEYRHDGRGVRQYRLNLPPKVKQRLWKQMDDLVEQGANLPYDYMKRGCAKSVLDCLKTAFAPTALNGPQLPITQRETFNRELAETHPWNLFFLNAIVGTETDTFTEVVTPKNLLSYLRQTTVGGVPLLTDAGRELLPQTLVFEKRLVSPFVAAWLVFALAALAWLRRGRWVTGALLAAQALAGCFFVFLVTASHLPNACWNWLLVPFNPVMPAVALGRRYRAVRALLFVYVAALAGWAGGMLLVPHAKTDPAYIVLAVAMAVVYAGVLRAGGERASKLARTSGERASELARTSGERASKLARTSGGVGGCGGRRGVDDGR